MKPPRPTQQHLITSFACTLLELNTVRYPLLQLQGPLSFAVIEPKCYPIEPDSLMFSTKRPWEGKEIWDFLKMKREIEELTMDGMTLNPVDFDPWGSGQNVRPHSFDAIPAEPPQGAELSPKLQQIYSADRQQQRP